MSGSSEDVKWGWESFYRKYAPDRLPWETGKPDSNLVELVEKGKIARGRVLDICSGLGTQTIYLAVQGFEVYGIDISPTAVDMAKQRCRKKGAVCHLTAGDAANLKYPDGFFTFIFDRGCFHHIRPQRRERFIKGLHRVLAEGGRYFMTCFSWRNGPAWNHFKVSDIRGYFSKHFRILETREESFVENVSGRKLYFLSFLMEAKKKGNAAPESSRDSSTLKRKPATGGKR
ncbi:class I SAM-dependent methyltransferase [Candidatus Hecatella orcuttiae]|uniref:class I SAM-dependent methyltransferase n=1 Tax=Candidatus Hecatella orcuttiae TaxID=1935119 RepID=UPI002867B3BF|nr:methyltransferase domain-containing protein [Candidatus Hecatella orcuttiae]